MSATKGTPHIVSIIVYGAKGLKPKKDKHKFSVIYGIRKSKFRTDIVEDLFDNPVFNKETEITVDSLDLELKFKVTEKNEKDVLGQVIVPLYELGDHSTSSPHKVPLRPHKKCPSPQGILIFEAWVTAKKVESVPTRSVSMESLKSIKSLGLPSGLKKLKERISHSSKPPSDKSHKKSSESLFNIKTRNAVSCQDLTAKSPLSILSDESSLQTPPNNSFGDFDNIMKLSDDYEKRNSLHLEKVNEFICPKPEVTSLSPKSGPESGGTVLTIRGSYLGQNQEDIVALNICGLDVLETLEYISPWKIQCTTLPWKPCIGSFNIETLSGGRGTSTVQFTFIENNEAKASLVLDTSSGNSQNKLDDGNMTWTEASESELKMDRNIDLEEVDVDKQVKGFWQNISDEETEQGNVHIESGIDGVLKLSVGGGEWRNLSETNVLDSKPLKSSVNEECDHIDGVIHRTASQAESNAKSEQHFLQELDITKEHGSKGTLQAGVSLLSPEISVGQESKAVTLNGTSAKQPPPVVEILPMRMEDNGWNSVSTKNSENFPPRKPPRQYPDKSTSNQGNEHSGKENELITDLEMELKKKTKEIEMLLEIKNGLQDENWRLKQYIEALVMRAISICPEVLCIDDSCC